MLAFQSSIIHISGAWKVYCSKPDCWAWRLVLSVWLTSCALVSAVLLCFKASQSDMSPVECLIVPPASHRPSFNQLCDEHGQMAPARLSGGLK